MKKHFHLLPPSAWQWRVGGFFCALIFAADFLAADVTRVENAADLRSAISVAAAGDTIELAAGIYQINQQLVINKAITLRGDSRETTILDGTPYSSGSDLHLLKITAAGALAENLTVCNVSGGMGAVELSAGTLSNCIISNNTGGANGYPWGGVGLKTYGSGVVVRGCEIINNKFPINGTYSGGAGAEIGGGALVVDTVISNNWVTGPSSDGCRGAGVRLRGGTLRNCLIAHNGFVAASSTKQGAGVYQDGGSAENNLIQNCTIVNNSVGKNVASGTGVGICGAITVENSIVRYNCDAAGIEANYSSSVKMTYSCSLPLPAGTGNTDAPPTFMNAAFDIENVGANSAIIDSGNNAAWMETATDLAGRARIANGTVDMGAYEAPALTLTCAFTISKTRVALGEEVAFSAEVGGSIEGYDVGVHYSWNFGDGTTGEDSPTVTHAFSTPGIYSVTLEIVNANGDTASRTLENAVKALPTIYASPDGASEAPYSSWESAATTIADALSQPPTSARRSWCLRIMFGRRALESLFPRELYSAALLATEPSWTEPVIPRQITHISSFCKMRFRCLKI